MKLRSTLARSSATGSASRTRSIELLLSSFRSPFLDSPLPIGSPTSKSIKGKALNSDNWVNFNLIHNYCCLLSYKLSPQKNFSKRLLSLFQFPTTFVSLEICQLYCQELGSNLRSFRNVATRHAWMPWTQMRLTFYVWFQSCQRKQN